MTIKTATIEDLKTLFGWNDDWKYHRNITVLGEKFLIHTLQKMNCVFDYTIAKEDKGKPYFLYNDKVHFSISDSDRMVAVAISDKRVGIDIEYLRKDKLQLAERFFHKDEYKYLQAVRESENDALHPLNDNILSRKDNTVKLSDIAFTQLWTIKESYVKMTGTGIAGHFSNIDLSPEKFDLQQDFIRNNHRIHSFYDDVNALFISTCEW